MATALFALRITNSEATNPILTTAGVPTLQSTINFFRGLMVGAGGSVTVATARDQAAASGTITLDTASGAVGAVINGVTVTATAAGGDNATASLVATAVNASANALVNKHVTAARTLTSATGTITIEDGEGDVGATIDGTEVTVAYATSDDFTAYALADAINANGTVSAKVTARRTASGVVTLTAKDTTTYGGIAGNALTLVASGTGVTVSDTTLLGGLTKVTFTSKLPGFAGNAVTLVASGTGITASGARLTGGTETQESFTFA